MCRNDVVPLLMQTVDFGKTTMGIVCAVKLKKRFHNYMSDGASEFSKMYCVYWICSDRRNYIGATTCIERRLRQHNGELKGGARRTCGRGPWTIHCHIQGFRTWKEALQFEWAFKYYSRGSKTLQQRAIALENLMQRERWTSNSPPSSEVELTVHWASK